MEKSYGNYNFVKSLRKTPTGLVNVVSNDQKNYYILQTMVFNNKSQQEIDFKKRLLRSLNHPNVEHVVEIIQQRQQVDDVLAIITDYCDDDTLEDKIGKFNEVQTRNAILDLCSAYRYFHQQLQLFHGYLTLQTVLIKNSRLIVSEFSHAEILKGDKKLHALKGQRQYMSPEMLNSKIYGYQSDIWSLGVLFIEILLRNPILTLSNNLPGHDSNFPNNLLNRISNTGIRQILKKMLCPSQNRISIKQVQSKFIALFQSNPLNLKVHNQYIEIRNFSTHNFLVKNLETENILSLKKYTLPKQMKTNLLPRIQKLKSLRHRNVISILDVRICSQCELEVITQCCDKKTLTQSLPNFEVVQMIEAIKDIWNGFLYLYYNKVLMLENLNPNKILIIQGKLKLPITTQYSFMQKKQQFTQLDCIWKILCLFLQIITQKQLKDTDIQLIKQKSYIIQSEDKQLQSLIKQLVFNYKNFTLETLDDLLRKQVYNRKYERQDSFIRDYKTLKEISRGCYGNVYLAEKLSSGSKVALKKICIPKDSALDSELNEALISMSLKHKNIVETYEYFVSKKNEFIIIMELCQNHTLRQMLGRVTDMGQKLKIMSQVSQGLDYLHNEKGMIHRDIKPTNILQKNGVMKIADMGRSKYVRPGQKLTSFDGGTLYMAPQMLNQVSYTISADVWNLGIVFLQILFNYKFPSDGILCLNPQFPMNYTSKISHPKLRDLISGMLQRNPIRRWPIKDVVNSIKDLIESNKRSPIVL